MFLSECSTNSLKAAAQSIAQGHLVAFPTETVYGLGADATNESAVAKIYKAKGYTLSLHDALPTRKSVV